MADKENQPFSGTSTQRDASPLRGFAKRFAESVPSISYDTGDKSLSLSPPRFRKKPFFFYGSLMDPATLAKVLRLNEKPSLQPAKILHYHYKLWGDFPALLHGPPGGEVNGVVFTVQSKEQIKLLKDYETNRYRELGVQIHLDNGSSVLVTTFLWRSSEEELRDGTFDLKDYQMEQMEKDIIQSRILEN